MTSPTRHANVPAHVPDWQIPMRSKLRNPPKDDSLMERYYALNFPESYQAGAWTEFRQFIEWAEAYMLQEPSVSERTRDDVMEKLGQCLEGLLTGEKNGIAINDTEYAQLQGELDVPENWPLLWKKFNEVRSAWFWRGFFGGFFTKFGFGKTSYPKAATSPMPPAIKA